MESKTKRSKTEQNKTNLSIMEDTEKTKGNRRKRKDCLNDTEPSQQAAGLNVFPTISTSNFQTNAARKKEIPPALWASGGLEALFPHFPHPQSPLGRGLPLPYPSPWSPSLPGQICPDLLWRTGALPEAIQKSFIFLIDF